MEFQCTAKTFFWGGGGCHALDPITNEEISTFSREWGKHKKPKINLKAQN